LGTYAPLADRPFQRVSRRPEVAPPVRVRATAPVALLRNVSVQEAAGLESVQVPCHQSDSSLLDATLKVVAGRR
jgi:hypothetical protein